VEGSRGPHRSLIVRGRRKNGSIKRSQSKGDGKVNLIESGESPGRKGGGEGSIDSSYPRRREKGLKEKKM